MSSSFRALVVRESDEGISSSIEDLTDDDLPDGDVTVDIEYSSLNYKDGMALGGRNRIIRSFPMVPGVDFTGTVAASDDDRWAPGDPVILTGWGVGERHWGGYSERQRTRADWLVRRPEGLSAKAAMGIGTAGLTAMLCLIELEAGGVRPDSGPVVVTGAAGGVGSVAVSLLAAHGYEVVAVTGRDEQRPYLESLGASRCLGRAEMSQPPRPLETETWAGAVDTVGSTMLARVLAQTAYDGVVAACGLAGGVDLPTTVMPFILRGVRLQGVDSVMIPVERRQAAWERLAAELPSEQLDEMAQIVPLSELPARAESILQGQVRGRVVVDPHR